MKLRRPRFRILTLLGVVAAIALGLGAWRDFTRPVNVWRRAARSPIGAIRSEAWGQANNGLIAGLTAEETREEVIAQADAGDPLVRCFALWALSHGQRDPVGLLPVFVRLLDDPDTRVRWNAAEAAGQAVRQLGTGRELAAPGLLKLLGDRDPWTRQKALEALGVLAEVGGGAKDPLLEAVAGRLADGDEGTRITAAFVLSRNGRGEEAIPLLEAHMLALRARNGGRDPGGTGTADNALARIAVRSDDVIAFLLRETYRKGQGLSNRFLFALQLIGGDAQRRAQARALATLGGEDRDQRIGAALYLESRGPAPATRPTWLEALHHPDPDVRAHAINSLSNLGRFDPGLRAAIRSVEASDPDPALREAATNALWLPPGINEQGEPITPPAPPEAPDAPPNP